MIPEFYVPELLSLMKHAGVAHGTTAGPSVQLVS